MRLLFVVTIFWSAALLFLVQPLVAKGLVPKLGGAPAVWNTCQLFFQAALLLGYSYAHLTPSRLGVRRQAFFHLILLGVTALVLLGGPLAFGTAVPPPGSMPIPWLLGTLVASVGLPFFVVSTSAPLLQRWFAETSDPDAADPYFLYSASNFGSLIGLFAYPFVLEPLWPLSVHRQIWAVGFGGLTLLMFGCAVVLWRSPRSTGPKDELAETPLEAISWSVRARWVLLAAVPSSLLLSVTTYLTADLAAIPLLWVVPLAIYLLTFIVAFARTSLVSPGLIVRLIAPSALLLVVVLLLEATGPLWVMVPIHLLGLFVIGLACHAELARTRPTPRQLTEFYLWMSLGGVLGGAFNALAAPFLFSSLAEYPIVLVLACLLRPQGPSTSRQKWLDLLIPAALGLTLVAVIQLILVGTSGERGEIRLLVLPGAAILVYLNVDRPYRFGLALVALLLAFPVFPSNYGQLLERRRDFFGVHRVTLDAGKRFHQLIHGNTVHGKQNIADADQRLVPLTYYYPTGPIGQVFEAFSGPQAKLRVAVVGLGTGSLASYARSGQTWTYFEIDPVVEQIARDPRFFTYLRDSAATPAVVLGDARLTLSATPDESFDLLVLDAFSSDSIPLHLLTREALEMYLRKLTPTGVLAFHTSNRYLNLQPLLGNLAGAIEPPLLCLGQSDLTLSDEERAAGKSPSQWVIMAHSRADLGSLAGSSRWTIVLPRIGGEVWTDEFSNILGVVRLNNEPD